MAYGVAAGASPSTSRPVSRTAIPGRTGRTRRDWFEQISLTRPSSTTARTSLGGVNSDPLPSSRAAWDGLAGWGRLRPTGGSRAFSSTATGGKRESRKPRWQARFASLPLKAAGRSMVILSPPGGNRTRAHSCSEALNQCSLTSDFVRSVLSVRVSWLCEGWFAVAGLRHQAIPNSLSVGRVNWSELATCWAT